MMDAKMKGMVMTGMTALCLILGVMGVMGDSWLTDEEADATHLSLIHI